MMRSKKILVSRRAVLAGIVAEGGHGVAAAKDIGPATPAMFGAPTDGTENSGPAIAEMLIQCAAIGRTAFIDRPYAVTSDIVIRGLRLHLVGGAYGEIRFAKSGSLTLVGCNDSTVCGLNISGALTSPTQFALYLRGSGALFAHPVLDDNPNNISIPDTGRRLEGDRLILTLEGMTGRAQRKFVSADIPLDQASRYMIDIEPGWVTGDGATMPVFTLLDAERRHIRQYDPQDDSGASSVIHGAAFLRVSVGVSRATQTADGLSCAYDLSKLAIYRCLNDMARIDLGPSVGGSAHVLIYSTSNLVWQGGVLRDIDRSAIKLIRCTDCEISGVQTKRVFQGFTTQDGRGSRFFDNQIDMRLGVEGGRLISCRVLRLRGVGSSGDDGSLIQRNYIRGASWGIEAIMNGSKFRHLIADNVIEAEFCGISSCNGGGGSIVRDNTIRLSSTGSMGIELAGGSFGYSGEAFNNDIRFADLVWRGVGYALSNHSQVRISGGYVNAPIACQSLTMSGSLVIEDLNTVYAYAMVYGLSGAISVRRLSGRLMRNIHVYDTIEPATIRLSGKGGQPCEALDCAFDATATLAVLASEASELTLAGLAIQEDGRIKAETIEISPAGGRLLHARLNRIAVSAGRSRQLVALCGEPSAGSSFVISNITLDGASAASAILGPRIR